MKQYTIDKISEAAVLLKKRILEETFEDKKIVLFNYYLELKKILNK